jgi:hypothetical protein
MANINEYINESNLQSRLSSESFFFHRQHSEKFVYFLSMQVKMYYALKKKHINFSSSSSFFSKSAVIMICCFVSLLFCTHIFITIMHLPLYSHFVFVPFYIL